MKRRKTRQSMLVSKILKKSRTAISRKEIMKKLRGSLDRVTVYRILNRFLEDGLVHKVISDEGKTFFAVSDMKCSPEKQYNNHIHFKCLKCSKVICLDKQIEFSLPKGFIPVDTNYFISGYCNKCRKQ
ncbi:MAG: transcriptional repressor [Ignavibacteria bacterium]|nr:transcriptional repressor [Ignavibacteria bacterium]